MPPQTRDKVCIGKGIIDFYNMEKRNAKETQIYTNNFI